MTIGGAVVAVLNLLAAIPQIAGFVEKAVGAAVQWYVTRQKRETLVMIADAAAFAARAENEDDRYAAAQKWRDALSRPRVGG